MDREGIVCKSRPRWGFLVTNLRRMVSHAQLFNEPAQLNYIYE